MDWKQDREPVRDLRLAEIGWRLLGLKPRPDSDSVAQITPRAQVSFLEVVGEIGIFKATRPDLDSAAQITPGIDFEGHRCY